MNKITIITVSYNAAATIEETILSVVDQTYPNIEYIIVDGGSTDGTVDIIKKYAVGGSEADKHNHKITKWISEPDHGIYDAMNKGIDIATGDYYYFIGADDKLMENAFNFLINSNFDETSVLYGNVINIPDNKFYAGKFDSFKIASINICHQAILYPHALKEQPYFNTNYPICADYELNLRLWRKCQFVYIDRIIAFYRTDGASSKGDAKFEKDFWNILKTNFGIFFYMKYRILMIMRNRLHLNLFPRLKE